MDSLHGFVASALLLTKSKQHFHFNFEGKHSKHSSKYYAGSVIVKLRANPVPPQSAPNCYINKQFTHALCPLLHASCQSWPDTNCC